MRTCFVRGCHNSDRNNKQGVSFHGFSKKLQSEWLSAIGRDPDLHIVNKKICSVHFDVDDFEQNGKTTRIKDNVIPTKNLPKQTYGTPYDINNLSTKEMPSSPLLIMISSSSNPDDEQETENIILEYEDNDESLETKFNMKEESNSSYQSSELNKESILGVSSTLSTYRSTSMECSVKGGGKKSIIWNHFTPQTKTKATCNFCNASLSYKTSISNLKKHMERKHTSIQIDSEITSENQEKLLITNNEDYGNIFNMQGSPQHVQSSSSLPSISPSQSTASMICQVSQITQSSTPKKRKIQTTFSTPKKKMDVLDKESLDDQLLRFITKDFQPLSIVESVAFQEFTRALNPLYILPSRKTLSMLLAKKYEEVEINTRDIIKNVKSVTITTDCWISCHNDSFLAVSAHFLNEEFQIKSIILEVASCIVSSTNLSRELSRIIMDWDLENKILLCISDDVASIEEAMCEELRDHLGCLAHTINLIVQEALEVVQPLVAKVSRIVSHIKGSTIPKAKLDFYQIQNGKEPKKLIQSICTRWNSVYYMLQRITELKEEVKTLLTTFGKEHWPKLSDEEFEIINELIHILNPMDSTIKIMSSDEQVTLSLVIIITNGLVDVYKQFMKNNTFSAQSKCVLEKIANGISTRLKDMESSTTLLVTTFLDPRFKHIGFSTDSYVEKAKALVTDALTVVIEEKNDENRTSKPYQLASNNQTPISTVWSLFEKKISSFTPSGVNQKSKAKIEIQRYLDQPLLDRTENPINWWKDNSHNFPYLSQLVKLKFGTVATSVPCERIFTKTGQLLMDRRDLLSANEVKQIMFIDQNSK